MKQAKEPSYGTEVICFGRKEMKCRDFWMECNDDFYKAFPERWNNEEPLYLEMSDAAEKATFKSFEMPRPRYEGEVLKEGGIWRSDRFIWEIGRTYGLIAKAFETDDILGWVKLVEVREGHLPEGGFVLKFQKTLRVSG